MQVSTNQFYSFAKSSLSTLSSKADTLQTQIATTKRLQAPSDDVVAYHQLQFISRANADDASYTASITTATGLLQQTDSTLDAVITQIQRVQELAVKANNDTLSDSDQAAIADELNGIVQTLAQLANSRDSRGNALFSGTKGGDPVTLNDDGSVTINDTGNPAAIPIASDQSIVPTETAQSVFGGIANGSGETTDLFSVITNFAAALNAGGDVTAAATKAGNALSAALTNASTSQASVGAREARLTVVSNAMTEAGTTREAQRSSLEDTNVTSAIADLQKTMTILQATQASFTKLSSLSLFSYLN